MSSGSTAALFPLPNVLLYPEAMLPLHVFEPRYLEMVQDMQTAGEDRIVVGLLIPGWEDDYFEQPRVHAIAGLGQVLQTRPAKNGRFNLLVQGTARVRILEELPTDKPYRTIRYERIEELQPADAEECARLHEGLRNGLIEFADGSLILQTNASLGYMADLLTVALPLSVEEKQALFSNLDVRERAARVLALVDKVNARRRSLKTAKDPGDGSSWN